MANTNDFHKNETRVRYLVADANCGMYSIEHFDTPDEAMGHIQKEYRKRSKRDGHDEYWRNMPLVILKITTIQEVVITDSIPSIGSLSK